SCKATSFVSGQHGFTSTFGMGFSANGGGVGETLYVASDQDPNTGAPRLGAIDTTTFALRIVGDLPSSANMAELTGTGAGDLFGFYGANGSMSADSLIGQIDKTSARVTGQSSLTGVSQGHAWAFAFWGGDFYAFTAPGQDSNSGTTVTRFRPSDGSIVPVAHSADTIVGAGVSTCAPQQ
ncbi:MAG TPA: hypothetical protein VKU41_10425, partial [Polyangiaceae bacterium]|nr:hypothetical protein [Polyangiaceae bacterium]